MKYKTIVIDPPWKYGKWGSNSGRTDICRQFAPSAKNLPLPYPYMSLDEIAALPIPDLADVDCELYVWTTEKYLPHTFPLLEKWGFKYCETLVWCKEPRGTGQGGLFTPTTEFIVHSHKGRMPKKQRIDTTWWKVTRQVHHSQKPEHFQDVIELVSDGPRLEMFARRERVGWDVFGNEVENSIQLPGGDDMLTKTLKFDDAVLTIIRAMEWQDDGKLGILTCGQLDRDLYERVNKALVAMGGKWNRSKGGHIFPLDPRPKVEGLVVSGELIVERDGFFETPIEVVLRMLDLVKPVGNVLEPSAGLGAIVNNIDYPIRNMYCVEKNEQRAVVLYEKGYGVYCGDFLALNPVQCFDTIFMNPPFEEGQDIDHVRHAYNFLKRGCKMVSVMSEGTFFRDDRKAVAFREELEKIPSSIEKLPEGSFKVSGTGVNTRLVYLRK